MSSWIVPEVISCRKRSRLSLRSEPVEIPGPPRICLPKEPLGVGEDEVFFDSNGQENRTAAGTPLGKKRSISSSQRLFLSPLGQSPSLQQALCVNSPGRRELQRESLDSRKDLHFLGRGSFGSVILGSWKGERVAVKVIARESFHHKKLTPKARSNSVESELNATDLCHPNVVKIHALFNDVGDENTVIIMEYVGQASLQKIMTHHPKRLTPAFLRKCFLGIASALDYIHSKEILHLDVKADNVFVTRQEVCKLGDFGCSRRVNFQSSSQSSPCKETLVGTPGFQAPEFLRNEPPTTKCDIYSYGVFLWQVIHRETPFRSVHPHSIIFQVVSQKKRPSGQHLAELNPSNPMCSTMNPRYKALYEACWAEDPDRRPSAKEIMLKLALPSLCLEKTRKKSSIRL